MNKKKYTGGEMNIDRKKNWKEFSIYMIDKYLDEPVAKYQVKAGKSVDLMAFTNVRICVYSILKYAIRLWNGHGKEKDFEKIAHFAEIAWSMTHKVDGGFVLSTTDLDDVYQLAKESVTEDS